MLFHSCPETLPRRPPPDFPGNRPRQVPQERPPSPRLAQPAPFGPGRPPQRRRHQEDQEEAAVVQDAQEARKEHGQGRGHHGPHLDEKGQEHKEGRRHRVAQAHVGRRQRGCAGRDRQGAPQEGEEGRSAEEG